MYYAQLGVGKEGGEGGNRGKIFGNAKPHSDHIQLVHSLQISKSGYSYQYILYVQEVLTHFIE